jgi:cytochrome c556
VRGVIIAGILLAFGGVAAAQEPVAQPEPILETGELMLIVIKPAYEELRRAVAAPPADRQQWAALYQKAARLAEFENLILFRPHQRSNTAEWKTLATNARNASRAVTSAALKALANAKEANFDNVRRAYEEVSARCNACHKAMSREAPRITPD